MCVARVFIFLSGSLLFTPNPGDYKPMSTCSFPNGLHFTRNLLSEFVPMGAVLYDRCGEGL